MPGFEYKLARSALARPDMLGRPTACVAEKAVVLPDGSRSMLLDRTLKGRDSREFPHNEDGASARTEALVSKEFLRRRLDEDARVNIEASSLSMPFAVAALYVCG